MYVVYEEHIEQLEEENADLKQEVLVLRKRLQYYKFVAEDEENDKPTVIALREIAEGHLDNALFHATENDLEKKSELESYYNTSIHEMPQNIADIISS